MNSPAQNPPATPVPGNAAAYPYYPHPVLLPAMALSYFAVAALDAGLARSAICIMNERENVCLGREYFCAAFYALLGLLMLVLAVMQRLRKNRGCLRLWPDAIEIAIPFTDFRLSFADITDAWLAQLDAESFVRLDATGRRSVTLCRRWLADPGAFGSLCHAIESGLGRPLATHPDESRLRSRQLVTKKAVLIAVILPAAIVALIYFGTSLVPQVLLTAVAALAVYTLYTLVHIIKKVAGRHSTVGNNK